MEDYSNDNDQYRFQTSNQQREWQARKAKEEDAIKLNDVVQKELLNKKKDQVKEKVKQKKCYDITAVAIIQTDVKYRVWAFDEKEAADQVKNGKATPIYVASPKITKNTLLSLSVFISGTINKLLSIRLR